MRSAAWIRFLRGSVRFSASGGFCERFINLCKVRGIHVWDLAVHEKSLSGAVQRRDYKRLRPVAKSAGMVLRATEKRGLPFFLQRHKQRRMLLFAGAACFLLLLGLSNCVWSIDATGTQGVSRAELISVMERHGLRCGVLRSKLDATALAQSAMDDLNGRLSWVAVNIDGSRAVIEARDYIPPDADETYGDPCNIVADFDGLLRSLEVHSGKKANQEGNGVKKGDLLISGVVENRLGEHFFYEARGIVTAEHKVVLRRSAPRQCAVRPYCSSKRARGVRCFGVPLQLCRFASDEETLAFSFERQLVLHQVPLPLAAITATAVTLGEAAPAAEAQSAMLLFDDFTAAAYAAWQNTTILHSKFTVKETKTTRSIRQDVRCIDFMGTPQKILRAQDPAP